MRYRFANEKAYALGLKKLAELREDLDRNGRTGEMIYLLELFLIERKKHDTKIHRCKRRILRTKGSN